MTSVSILNGIHVCDLNFNRDISIELGIPFALVVIFLAYANKYFKHLAAINIAFEELSQMLLVLDHTYSFDQSTNCLFINKTFFFI